LWQKKKVLSGSFMKHRAIFVPTWFDTSWH
jgi:hypothetical protein